MSEMLTSSRDVIVMDYIIISIFIPILVINVGFTKQVIPALVTWIIVNGILHRKSYVPFFGELFIVI
mgnify:CR=1 FL=1